MGPIQIFPKKKRNGKICMGPIQIFPKKKRNGKICMGPIQFFFQKKKRNRKAFPFKPKQGTLSKSKKN
jgi:hypothetical protein